MWLFRLLFRRLMRLLRVGACGQASRRRRRRRGARFSPHGKGPAAKQGRCQVRLQGGGEPRIWQPPAARAAVPSPTREFPTCLLARAPRAGRAVMQKITPYRPRSWRHSHPLLPCKSPRGVRKREKQSLQHAFSPLVLLRAVTTWKGRRAFRLHVLAWIGRAWVHARMHARTFPRRHSALRPWLASAASPCSVVRRRGFEIFPFGLHPARRAGLGTRQHSTVQHCKPQCKAGSPLTAC